MSIDFSLEEIKKIWPSSAPDLNNINKYVEKYKDETIVIKYGGNVLIDGNIFDSFIKDIIEYSRNKHKNIDLEPINFNTLIEQSLESFWYLENSKKIKIDINIDDKEQFVSDSKRVSVLLNNFISNAIKYHDLNKESPYIHIIEQTIGGRHAHIL